MNIKQLLEYFYPYKSVYDLSNCTSGHFQYANSKGMQILLKMSKRG